MRNRSIRPRKIVVRGIEKWLVHLPKDLQSPNQRIDRTFGTAREADLFAKQLTKERGKPIPNEFNKYPALEQSEALRWLAEKRKTLSMTVAEAAEKCMAAKTASGKRKGSLVASACAFRSLGKMIGNKPIQDVVADDIGTWMASHTDWVAKTKLNNFKLASSLFAWCVNNRLLTYNPCKGVMRPAVPFKPVKILKVPQIRQLLKTCGDEDPAMLGFFSLVLFGGLRVAEARRCLASNLTNGTIDLGGESCKLNERRCVKMSSQLCAWLSKWQSNGGLYGKIEVPNFVNRMQWLVKKSGVVLPKNALRHSFCSYALELLGADATARAANNSPTMLYKHYVSQVTKEDAVEFSKIYPELKTVAEILPE